MHDIAIDKVMTSDPATVSPQSSAAEARRLLDSNVIVGIVSSSDLLKLHLLDNTMALFTRATVDQIMETNVTVLGKNSTLREAVEKLSMGNFHALPVVDRKRRLLGIVTSTDLMNELMLRLGD
jgi:osmoprotectant transport system ATP-binding protein